MSWFHKDISHSYSKFWHECKYHANVTHYHNRQWAGPQTFAEKNPLQDAMSLRATI